MRISLFVAAALVTLISPPSTASSWNDPTSDQYHIQTDEGAERYFRYQTHTGQYRKEKRLEDGTVVGTYGWIDSDGLLRLKDYIADNAGYRILRTKNVFVGRHRPISQAIKAAKKVPSSSGVLSSSNSYILPTPSSANIPSTTTESPHVSTAVPPFVISGPHSTYSTTISPVDVSATPSSVHLASPVYISSTLAPPSTSATSPRTVYITSKSTGASIQSTATPLYNAAPESYGSKYAPPTVSPSINSNFVDYYSSDPQYEHFDPKLLNPYVYHNGPTYPIDHRGNPYLGYNNIIKGYDHQYDNYNGVPVTNDGFRYYIPRAYHEEQNLGDKKTGSFGYIDPFGIRRVVYYSAGQDGFKHRKNNRYVGFNSPPYDERTYK